MEMPPRGQPAPTPDERDALADWIDGTLRAGVCAVGFAPGPQPLRRLNRNEYAATIRDLLSVHFNAGASLPNDGAGGEGFDNAAETLFLSPMHAEKYLEAARQSLDYGLADPRSRADFLIDAEGHYEGRYPQASTYMRTLRRLVGAGYPLALAAFPYVDYHPAFPYSVFLGPNGAQYNAPQLYWKTIGATVDEAFIHTWVFNRAYGRPILPLGQVYLNPKSKQIKRFRRLAQAYGMEGVSWWSWQHARKRQWKAVGKRVAPLSSSVVYDSYPTLRPGSKGDLVAWAQQLLAGGGFSTPITGYYQAPTRGAVSSLQSSRGLPATGSIDSATWRVMLEFEPVAVRWTKKGAVPASGKGLVLPPPRSAALPAKRYEIPSSARRP
jgi:hypothetical protein